MRRIFVAGIAIWVATSLGCGSRDGDRQLTAPVEVTVSYKNKPVEGATVSFMRSTGGDETSTPAFGMTDANGKVKLTTFEENDGAALGTHIVLVVKQEFEGQKEAPSEDSPEYNPGATPLPKVRDLLPSKYALPTTSGLEAIVASGKNQFSFELTD